MTSNEKVPHLTTTFRKVRFLSEGPESGSEPRIFSEVRRAVGGTSHMLEQRAGMFENLAGP